LNNYRKAHDMWYVHCWYRVVLGDTTAFLNGCSALTWLDCSLWPKYFSAYLWTKLY